MNLAYPTYTYWSATDENSVLDISALQNLSGEFTVSSSGVIMYNDNITGLKSVTINDTTFSADYTQLTDFGGTVTINDTTVLLVDTDLTKLKSISNYTITADGVTIDLPNCEVLNSVTIYARNGGTVNLPNLTKINGLTLYDKEYSATTYTGTVNIDWTKITNIKDFTLYAQSAGERNFVSLKTMDNFTRYSSTSSTAYQGTITLDWSQITSIKNSGTITADNQEITLSSLVELVDTSLMALNNGKITLSVLDNTKWSGGTLSATAGGQIVFPTTITALNGTTITFDADYETALLNLDLSKIESIRNGSITAAGGATLDFSACTELDYTHLTAISGGKISFANLESYTGTTFRTWTATGANSEISFEKLTDLGGSLTINAQNGGKVSLAEATSIYWVHFSATGGSFIDLSALAEFSSTYNSSSGLQLTTGTGGQIQLHSGITSMTNTTLNIAAPEDLLNFDATLITSIVNSAITLNGGVLDFANCTELENTALTAQNGCIIKFPKLCTATISNYSSYRWHALGANSRIEMSTLKSIDYTGTGFGSVFYADTTNGGVLDLSVLETAHNFHADADGAGSHVDISALKNLQCSYRMTITTAGGGKVTVHDDVTSLENLTLTVADITDLVNFDATKITSIKNSSITANGGIWNFSNCTELVNVNLTATNGTVIRFPKITSYTSSDTNNNTWNTWSANGVGSLIEMSVLTALENVRVNISATSGGNFDIPKIESIKNCSLTANAVTLDFANCEELEDTNLTTNNGAVLKFSNLTSFTPTESINWTANGNGSRLEFNTLTTLNAEKLGAETWGTSKYLTITGFNGGIVSFPELVYDIRGGVVFSGGGVETPKMKAIIVGGTITENTVWDNTELVYFVSENLTIANDVTLTIKGGVTVAGLSQRSQIVVNGNLVLDGSVNNSVLLTTIYDPRVSQFAQLQEHINIPEPPSSGDIYGWYGWYNISVPGGQWRGVHLGTAGVVTANHFEISFAMEGIDNINNTTRSTFNNGVFSYNVFGISSESGKLTVNNCVFTKNDRGVTAFGDTVGAHSFTNCTFVDNRIGIDTGAPTWDITNCIFAFNQTGIGTDPDGKSANSPPIFNLNNCIFWNPDGQDLYWGGFYLMHGETAPPPPDITINGNKIANPLFVSRLTGNYRLQSNSPAIDAGKNVPLPTDILGDPRYDDPNVANVDTQAVDIGAYERQEASSDVFDIAVSNVQVTPTVVNANEYVTVSWTVFNNSSDEINAGNTAIFLSRHPYASSDDILLIQVNSTLMIAAGESHTFQQLIRLPSSAGGSYYILVRGNNDKVIAENDYSNNIAVSSVSLDINVPKLTLDTPVSGTVTAKNWMVYVFDVIDENQVTFTVNAADSKWLSLYLRKGNAPTFEEYEVITQPNTDGTLTLRLLNPTTGTYYLGIYDSATSGTHSLNVTATVPPLGVRALSNTVIVQSGVSSILVTGDSFTNDTRVLLVPTTGGAIEGVVEYVDSAHLSVRFDGSQTAIPVQEYTLQVIDGGETVSFAEKITVTTVSNIKLEVSLSSPDYVRPGRYVTLELEYVNTGTVDMAAPILRISNGVYDFEWRIPGTDTWVTGDSVEFLALSSTGGAILRPGERVQMEIRGKVPQRLVSGSHGGIYNIQFVVYSLGKYESATLFDFNSFFDQFRTEEMSDSEFNKVKAKFTETVGTTYGDYANLLARHWAERKADGDSRINVYSFIYAEWLRVVDLCTPHIAGRVTDNSGQGVAGLSVYAGGANEENSGFAVTDKDGYYVISNLALDTYTVFVNTSGSYKSVDSQSVIVSNTDGNAGIDFANLDVGQTVNGRITKADGSVVADAMVSFRDADDNLVLAVTDENGFYSVSGLSAGEITVDISAEDCAAVRGVTQNLVSGQSLNFNYTLNVAVLVSGTVKTAAGIAVVGSYIIVMGEDEKDVFMSMVDEDGTYSFSDIMGGLYSVHVYFSDGTLNQKDTWTLTTGQNVLDKDYVLATWSGISGAVKDSYNNAIAGIEVILQNDDDVFLVATTDASGMYYFTTLLPGSYMLTVLSAGIAEEVTIVPGQESITKDLALSYTASVTGHLDGSNVLIQIFKNDDYIGSFQTDDKGWFNVHLNDAGLYSFYASSADTIFTPQIGVSIAANSNIVLNMPAGSHKAAITASGSFISTLTTYYSLYRLNSDGFGIEMLHGISETAIFEITGLIAGNYKLIALNGNSLAETTFSVSSSDASASLPFVTKATLEISLNLPQEAGINASETIAWLFDSNDNLVSNIYADESGILHFAYLENGTYTLIALNGQYAIKQTITVDEPSEKTSVALLAAPVTITGTVTVDGSIASGGFVFIEDDNGIILGIAEIDESGNYVLLAIKSDTNKYKLSVFATGGETTTKDLSFSETSFTAGVTVVNSQRWTAKTGQGNKL